MKTQKTGFVYRSTSVMAGALATVVVLLASSFGSVALAAWPTKGYGPAECRSFGPFDSSSVQYYQDRVRNASASDYAYVICPIDHEDDHSTPELYAYVFFQKPTASAFIYCYLYSVSSNSQYSYFRLGFDNTNASSVLSMYVNGFGYGSYSTVCGLPPGSSLLSYYAREV